MDQIGNELKKVLKAGIGAVAAGVEKTQDAIETLAQKGEPLYEQAKSAVIDAAGKVKKAVDDSGITGMFACRSRVEKVVEEMQTMTREELDAVREALEDIYPGASEQPEAPQAPNDAPAQAEDNAPQSENDDSAKPQ